MTIDADVMVERRRLRRKLSFWRLVALLVAIGAVAALLSNGAGERFGDQIARVPISGMITDDWRQREFLRKLGETERVKAVILAINSPGGTTGGGEALYEAVRALSEKKPVVAAIGTVGASAAYLAAIAADRVIVRETSITGSIGAFIQWANLTALGDKVGVEMREVKSDPLKAEPSPFNADTPAELRVLQDMIDDTHAWFLERVAERRGLSAAEARELGNGRIFSGRRAVELKIADAIGGESAARDWLVAEKGISEDAKIVEWAPASAFEELGFGARIAALATRLSGLENWLSRLPGLAAQPGLMSIWRPEGVEN